MKSEWKSCALGDLITFQRGYDLPRTRMSGNLYPVVGSNGIIGYHDEYTTEPPCITIGRSGNVGKPFLVNEKSWSHNTTLFIKNFYDVDPIFIYYFLRTLDLGNYAGGSAVPTLNRNHIHNLPVTVPCSIDVQRKIATILLTLDDKIEINNRINENLMEQVHTIFRSMFLNSDVTVPATIADVSINITDGVHNTVRDDPNGEYMLLSCKNIKGGQLTIGANERTISKEVFEKLRQRTQLAKGDVLISSVGTIGELLLLNVNPCNYELKLRSIKIPVNP